MLLEPAEDELIRHSRRAPRGENPLAAIRRERGPAPQVVAGLGGREAYDALGLLQVDEDDLQSGALARAREQVRAAARADERARQQAVYVEPRESFHETVPYLVDDGHEDGRRAGIPRVQGGLVYRKAARVWAAQLVGEP